MDDSAHRARRRWRRRGQLRGVHRLRAVAGAVRRDRRGVRRGAGRARRPGRRRSDRAPAVHGADDGHRVRARQHRRALRRLRAERRRPDPGGDLGRRDQGLLRAGQGGHPGRPSGRRHRRVTGRPHIRPTTVDASPGRPPSRRPRFGPPGPAVSPDPRRRAAGPPGRARCGSPAVDAGLSACRGTAASSRMYAGGGSPGSRRARCDR
nr:hypothetical protein [Streptomyces sp. TSRI0395]